jgi:hypothetical protein
MSRVLQSSFEFVYILNNEANRFPQGQNPREATPNSGAAVEFASKASSTPE